MPAVFVQAVSNFCETIQQWLAAWSKNTMKLFKLIYFKIDYWFDTKYYLTKPL